MQLLIENTTIETVIYFLKSLWYVDIMLVGVVILALVERRT